MGARPFRARACCLRGICARAVPCRWQCLVLWARSVDVARSPAGEIENVWRVAHQAAGTLSLGPEHTRQPMPDRKLGDPRARRDHQRTSAVCSARTEGRVKAAREQYGVIIDLVTAKAWIETFKRTYPDYTRWCGRFANACSAVGEISIRPRRRARPRDPLEPGRLPLHAVPSRRRQDTAMGVEHHHSGCHRGRLFPWRRRRCPDHRFQRPSHPS